MSKSCVFAIEGKSAFRSKGILIKLNAVYEATVSTEDQEWKNYIGKTQRPWKT